METRLVMIIVGIVLILFTVSGLAQRQRKNQWLVNLLGETGFKLLNIIIGLVFIVLGIVLF